MCKTHWDQLSQNPSSTDIAWTFVWLTSLKKLQMRTNKLKTPSRYWSKRIRDTSRSRSSSKFSMTQMSKPSGKSSLSRNSMSKIKSNSNKIIEIVMIWILSISMRLSMIWMTRSMTRQLKWKLCVVKCRRTLNSRLLGFPYRSRPNWLRRSRRFSSPSVRISTTLKIWKRVKNGGFKMRQVVGFTISWFEI